MDFALGTFTADATDTPGATQDVNVGFTPKLICIWGTEWSNGSDDLPGGNDVNFSYGWSDGTNHRVQAFSEAHLVGTTVCMNSYGAARVIRWIEYLLGQIRAEATLAWIANGFRITWTVGSKFPSVLNYAAWGGSEIACEVGSFVKQATSLASQPVVTGPAVGGIANGNGILILMSGYGEADDDPTDHYQICTGMTNGTSGAAGAGICLGISAEALRGSARPRNMVWDTDLLRNHQQTAGTNAWRMVFGGFNSDPTPGFTIDYLQNDDSLPHITYAIVKGGYWEAGFERSGTTVNQTVLTSHSLPNPPIGYFGLSSYRDALGQAIEDTAHTINAGDGTNLVSAGYGSVAQATQSVLSNTQSTSRMPRWVTNAVLIESDLLNLTPLNFGLRYPNVEGVGRYHMYLLSAPQTVSQEIAVPLTQEQDDALVFTRQKAHIPKVEEEFDESFPIAREKRRGAGLTNELDDGLTITPARRRQIDLSETLEESLPFRAIKIRGIPLAQSENEAPGKTPAKGHQLAVNQELDQGLVLPSAKVISVGLTTEMDQALDITLPSETVIGTMEERDSALPFGSTKVETVGLTETLDSAPVIASAKAVALPFADSLDAALPIALDRNRWVNVAVERNESLPITAVKSREFPLVNELDDGLNIQEARAYPLAVADELDEPLPIDLDQGTPPPKPLGGIPHVWYIPSAGIGDDEEIFTTLAGFQPIGDLIPTIIADVLPDPTRTGLPTQTREIRLSVGMVVDVLLPFHERIGKRQIVQVGFKIKRGHSVRVIDMKPQGSDAIIRLSTNEADDQVNIATWVLIEGNQRRDIDLIATSVLVPGEDAEPIKPIAPPVPPWPLPPTE